MFHFTCPFTHCSIPNLLLPLLHKPSTSPLSSCSPNSPLWGSPSKLPCLLGLLLLSPSIMPLCIEREVHPPAFWQCPHCAPADPTSQHQGINFLFLSSCWAWVQEHLQQWGEELLRSLLALTKAATQKGGGYRSHGISCWIPVSRIVLVTVMPTNGFK